MTARRVAVIGGGPSGEHDVSLASAAAAAAALDPRRWTGVPLTLGRDLRWHDGQGRVLSLAAAVERLQSCAVALPLLHGPGGEDGTMAALLDLAQVPYVGSGLAASALAMDKHATKLVAAAAGVAVARGVLLTRGTADAWLASPATTTPVVVKPVAAGSSLGVSLVREQAGLAGAVAEALRHDDRVLVEELLVGREVDVAVVGRPHGGHLVAPALEVVADGLFDHATKYDGSADLRCPADLAEVDAQELERAAVTVYEALGCRGLARVDFFLTDAGPVLNEVNTTPGFTPASQAPRMLAAAGVDYPALLDLLLGDALALAAARVA